MADSISELARNLGHSVRQLRLARNLDQRTTAERAGISLRALGMLENGRGSTLETMLRTLKALGYEKNIEMLAPAPTVNPLALLKTSKTPRRVRHSRKAGLHKVELPQTGGPETGVSKADMSETGVSKTGSPNAGR
ncbi:MAG TPA: helix-turn-helix transcriptional regulator [Candidatus Sulfotelmatobacter sp.]|jgi:transcriptional regulator with XRE-family HTH domain|nr:helix-turn-helix transcriptional regulator [Candidatus Sulfotelmatobacter sp.]